MANATRLFRLSLALIDAQVMGKGDMRHMGLNRTMGEAVIRDRPRLNVVYVPRIFQPGAETFGEDYLFTVPNAVNTVAAAREIPYEAMRPPIVYIAGRASGPLAGRACRSS